MGKILSKPNVWDLHIHTSLGTHTKKNYNGDDSKTFVDTLLKIYEQASYRIGMISFTDHNKINAEVYQEFSQRDSNIVLLPGIEVDVLFSEDDKKSKHVIFYFSENEIDTINELKKLVEGYLEPKTRVMFGDFVMFLVDNKKRFVVSPHAFKQKERGIDFGWVDEESAARGIREFSGLFFPFWEASGKTEISRAIEFLQRQTNDKEDVQPVIAFSDSSSYDTIEKYMESPNQFFLCLNSFRGVLMAGSDSGRIIYEYEDRPKGRKSEIIKEVEMLDDISSNRRRNKDGITIQFSDRLNAIVGGRGKGKSALLDAIAASLNGEKVDKERAKFVNRFQARIKNFNDMPMPSKMAISYYSQSYISMLFKEGSSSSNLRGFFAPEFNKMHGGGAGVAALLSALEKYEIEKPCEDINLSEELELFKRIREDRGYPLIEKTVIQSEDLSVSGMSFTRAIKDRLDIADPIWDEELEQKLSEFVSFLLGKIASYNFDQKVKHSFTEILRKKIDEVRSRKSAELARKNEAKENIKQKLRYLYGTKLQKIRVVNRLYSIAAKMTEIQFEDIEAKGEGNNKFYFVSYRNREHPVEYAYRMINSFVDGRSCGWIKTSSISDVLLKYAITEEVEKGLKDMHNADSLMDKLINVDDIKDIPGCKIFYVHNGVYEDLHKTSPGTQTNAIMEYALHTDSTAPLLIDQPEDNIDNEARFSKLTKWIRKQKYNRQIILVTHDANIVINGDAENVVFADHTNDKFSYSYGALEDGDVLERAAVILDGGRQAVRRRMAKYGE